MNYQSGYQPVKKKLSAMRLAQTSHLPAALRSDWSSRQTPTLVTWRNHACSLHWAFLCHGSYIFNSITSSPLCLSEKLPAVWWARSGGLCGVRAWAAATPLPLKPGRCWNTSWRRSEPRGRGNRRGSSPPSRVLRSAWTAVVAVSTRSFQLQQFYKWAVAPSSVMVLKRTVPGKVSVLPRSYLSGELEVIPATPLFCTSEAILGAAFGKTLTKNS